MRGEYFAGVTGYGSALYEAHANGGVVFQIVSTLSGVVLGYLVARGPHDLDLTCRLAAVQAGRRASGVAMLGVSL